MNKVILLNKMKTKEKVVKRIDTSTKGEHIRIS